MKLEKRYTLCHYAYYISWTFHARYVPAKLSLHLLRITERSLFAHLQIIKFREKTKNIPSLEPPACNSVFSLILILSFLVFTLPSNIR